MSDRHLRFTSALWSKLHCEMGTKLYFSTTFDLQTGGQSKITIHTLDNMLQACVLDLRVNWERHQPLIEFAYNNSFHSNIGMPLFEALYNRKCRSPIYWKEIGKQKLLGAEMVQITMDKIKLIKE